MDTTTYRRPNILFLRSLTIDELKLALAETTERDEARTGCPFTALPERFRDIDSWPRTTTLKCWQCDCNFNSIPYFIPTDMYRDRDGETVMDVYGVFCTANCAQLHINVYFKGDSTRFDKEQWLKRLYKVFTGKSVDKIVPAPSKTCMQQYRGETGISHRQFREHIDELAGEYELSSYKIEHISRSAKLHSI